MYELQQPLAVCLANHITSEKDSLLHHQTLVSLASGRPRAWLVKHSIVRVDQMLDLSHLDNGIQIRRDFGNLDDLGVDGAARLLLAVVPFLSPVEIGHEITEALHVLHAVFIYADLLGVLVGLHERFEEGLLKLHGAREPLAIRSNGGLQAGKVEFQSLASKDALHQFGEASFRSSGQHDTQSILLLYAQVHQLDDLLVPPSFPSSLLLTFDAFTRRR